MFFWSDSPQTKFILLVLAQVIIWNTKKNGFSKRNQEIERFRLIQGSLEERQIKTNEKHKNKDISCSSGQIHVKPSLFYWFELRSIFGTRKRTGFSKKNQEIEDLDRSGVHARRDI